MFHDFIGLFFFFCLYSLIIYMPSRVIRWLIFHPASLTSTSFISVQKVIHIRPSGRSIKAQGTPSCQIDDQRFKKVTYPRVLYDFHLCFLCLFIDKYFSSLCLQILSCFIHQSTLHSAFHMKLCYTSLLMLVPNQNETISMLVLFF